MSQLINAQTEYYSKVDELQIESQNSQYGLQQDRIELARRYNEELLNIDAQSTISDEKKNAKKKERKIKNKKKKVKKEKKSKKKKRKQKRIKKYE